VLVLAEALRDYLGDYLGDYLASRAWRSSPVRRDASAMRKPISVWVVMNFTPLRMNST
jgi:hypothetical protein